MIIIKQHEHQFEFYFFDVPATAGALPLFTFSLIKLQLGVGWGLTRYRIKIHSDSAQYLTYFVILAYGEQFEAPTLHSRYEKPYRPHILPQRRHA